MAANGSDGGLDWGSATWRRACGDSTCVEVAALGDVVAVRDSKRPDAAVLVFDRAEWEAFRNGVVRGAFDDI